MISHLTKRFFPSRGLCLLVLLLAAISSGCAQTEEVKTNQVVILKMPSGPAKVVRAKQVEVKELVVMIMDADGKRSASQKSLVAKMVDLHDESEKLDKTKIEEIITDYTKTIAEFPESKEILDVEIQKWKKVTETADKAAADLASTQEQALQEATKTAFEDSKNYTKDELANVVDFATATARQHPSLHDKIQEYLKPWQQRSNYLKEGRKIFEGRWMTSQEILEIQEARMKVEQEKHFKEKAKLSFSSLILPQSSVLLTILIAVGTLLSVLFSFYHLATSRNGTLSFGGAIVLLLGLGILGAYGYYGFQMLQFTSDLKEYWPEAYSAVPEDKLANPLPHMLFMASGSTNRSIGPEDARVTLQDTQMNALIKKFVKLERKSETKFLDLERLQTVVRLHGDRIEFVDEAQCHGKKILIRYDIYYKSEADTFSIYDQVVYVGGAKLPSSVGSFLFRHFYADLTDFLAGTNIPQIYTVETVQAGTMNVVWPLALASVKVKPNTPSAKAATPSAEAAAVPAGTNATP